MPRSWYIFVALAMFCFFLTLILSSFWTSRGHRCCPFSPPHRVQQSHCSSIFHRVLLTHALPLSASQFVPEKKSQRIYTSMHSAELELTKLTYTRLEDNPIRHRGDRYFISSCLEVSCDCSIFFALELRVGTETGSVCWMSIGGKGGLGPVQTKKAI